MRVATKKSTVSNSSAKVSKNDPARLAAQQEWAKEQLTGDDGNLIKDMLVVCPVFEKKGSKWVPTDTVVRPSKNPEFGLIVMYGANSGSGGNNISSLRWISSGSNNLATCIVQSRVEKLEEFEAGALVDGRIDMAYQTWPTNPENEDQDRHYISKDARELGLYSSTEDGDLYEVRFWQPDLSAPKQKMPEISNRKDIMLAIAANKGREIEG